jgi:enamine deaminase RidA (YjgF/YER057c/UK114 family)
VGQLPCGEVGLDFVDDAIRLMLINMIAPVTSPIPGKIGEGRRVLGVHVWPAIITSSWTRTPMLRDMIAERLEQLGIVLPPVSAPVGNYLGCVVDDGMVYVGGHGPVNGGVIIRGKVGRDLTLEQGRDAARQTGLSILASLRAELGDLDRLERIVKVFGMVNVAPGFNQTPAVIDGCSDLLVEIFEDAGRHTRSAVGLAELPFDIAVEIELTARLRP